MKILSSPLSFFLFAAFLATLVVGIFLVLNSTGTPFILGILNLFLAGFNLRSFIQSLE